MSAHWVTINGNHVLLDDGGRSLTDSECDNDEKKTVFPGLKSLEARQMASSLQEMHEASTHGMNWNDLKADKLRVTPETLKAIGAVEPKFQAMSADDLQQFFEKWKSERSPFLGDVKNMEDLMKRYVALAYSDQHETRRNQMAQDIVNFEAQREKNGKIRVYPLPANDGGGAYEVAGVNEKYHPVMALKLKRMIEAGYPDEAEKETSKYIAAYTDRVGSYTSNPAIEFYLRDTAWNRGPTGATKILQDALGVQVDGKWGPSTKLALQKAEQNPLRLLDCLYETRRGYEDARDGRKGSRPNLKHGLEDRWSNALEKAKEYLSSNR